MVAEGAHKKWHHPQVYWIDSSTLFEKSIPIFSVILYCLSAAMFLFLGYILASHYSELTAAYNDTSTSVNTW
jgi:hypothetical protein